MCVLGVEGSEKECGPPRIISGTALTIRQYDEALHQLVDNHAPRQTK